MLDIGNETCYIGAGRHDAECTYTDVGELKYFDMPPGKPFTFEADDTNVQNYLASNLSILHYNNIIIGRLNHNKKKLIFVFIELLI